MIGDEIEITIVDIRGDKVRLGINAPKSVSLHRKEVYEAIRRENQAAAQVRPEDLNLPPLPTRMKIATEAPATETPAADPFMAAAIEEARKGMAEGGLPIGSVLVRDGQIIARGRNQRVQKGDAMAHAEIDCLHQAGRQKTYKNTILYSTLMPCYLCAGAVVQFGIPKVIVGESTNFPGGEGPAGNSPDFLRSHGVEVINLHDPECIDMMKKFIKEHPDLWDEDIGQS